MARPLTKSQLEVLAFIEITDTTKGMWAKQLAPLFRHYEIDAHMSTNRFYRVNPDSLAMAATTYMYRLHKALLADGFERSGNRHACLDFIPYYHEDGRSAWIAKRRHVFIRTPGASTQKYDVTSAGLVPIWGPIEN